MSWSLERGEGYEKGSIFAFFRDHSVQWRCRHTDAGIEEGKEEKLKWREHVFDYLQGGRMKGRDIPFLTLGAELITSVSDGPEAPMDAGVNDPLEAWFGTVGNRISAIFIFKEGSQSARRSFRSANWSNERGRGLAHSAFRTCHHPAAGVGFRPVSVCIVHLYLCE